MSKKRKPSSYVQNIVEQQNRTVLSRVQFENLHPGARQFAEENKLGGSRSYVSQLQRELEKQLAINALVLKALEKEEEKESLRIQHISENEAEEFIKSNGKSLQSRTNERIAKAVQEYKFSLTQAMPGASSYEILRLVDEYKRDIDKDPSKYEISTKAYVLGEVSYAKQRKEAQEAWNKWRQDPTKNYWEQTAKDPGNPFTYVVGHTESSGDVTLAQVSQGVLKPIDEAMAYAKELTRQTMQQRDNEYTQMTLPLTTDEIYGTPLANQLALDRGIQSFNEAYADTLQNPYEYDSGPLLLLDEKFRKDAFTSFKRNMNLAQRDAFNGQILTQQEVLERAIDPLIEYYTAEANGVKDYPVPEGAIEFLKGYAIDPYRDPNQTMLERGQIGINMTPNSLPSTTNGNASGKSVRSLWADVNEWLDGVISPRIDLSWWSTPVDESASLLNKLVGVLNQNLSAKDRLNILKNYRSEAYKKIEYWKNGLEANQKDIDDLDKEHKISEYYQAKERATLSINALDPDVLLFKMPGLIGSSLSSWIKQAPQTYLSLVGLALLAVPTPQTEVAGYIASGVAGAMLPLNISASRDENYAQIVEGYQEKMKNLLESTGKYKEFLDEGAKKLGTTDPTEIMEGFTQGRYVPTNPEIQELGVRARRGLMNQFNADMLATTGDDIVDASLTILPVGKISKAARTGMKAVKSSKVVTWLGEKVAGPVGKYLMKPVEWALEKTGAAAKLDKYATDIARFSKAVPYKVLGKDTYRRTAKWLDGFFGDRSIAHRIFSNPADYAYYDTIKRFGKSVLKRDLASAWSEGIEEGKQYLNAQAFANGEFEDDEYRGMFNPRNILNDLVQGTRSSYVMAGIPFGLHLTDDEDLLENIRGGMLGGLFQTGAQVATNQAIPMAMQLRANAFVADASTYATKLATLGKIEDRDSYLKGIMYSKKALGGSVDQIRLAFQQYRDANEANRGTDKYVDPKLIDEQIDDFNSIVNLVNGATVNINPETLKGHTLLEYAEANGIKPNDKNDRFHKFVSLWYHNYKNENVASEERNKAESEEEDVIRRVADKYFADYETGHVINRNLLKQTSLKLNSIFRGADRLDKKAVESKIEELKKATIEEAKESGLEVDTSDDRFDKLNEDQIRLEAIAEIANKNVSRNMTSVARIQAIKGLISQIRFAIDTNQSQVPNSNRDLKFMLRELESRLKYEMRGILPEFHDAVLNNADSYFVGVSEEDKQAIFDAARNSQLRYLDELYYRAARLGLEGKYAENKSESVSNKQKRAGEKFSQFDAKHAIDAADKALKHDLELQLRIEQDWQDRQFERYVSRTEAGIRETERKKELEKNKKENAEWLASDSGQSVANPNVTAEAEDYLANFENEEDEKREYEIPAEAQDIIDQQDLEDNEQNVETQPVQLEEQKQEATTTDTTIRPLDEIVNKEKTVGETVAEMLNKTLSSRRKKYQEPKTSSRTRGLIVVAQKTQPVTVINHGEEITLNEDQVGREVVVVNSNPAPKKVSSQKLLSAPKKEVETSDMEYYIDFEEIFEPSKKKKKYHSPNSKNILDVIPTNSQGVPVFDGEFHVGVTPATRADIEWFQKDFKEQMQQFSQLWWGKWHRYYGLKMDIAPGAPVDGNDIGFAQTVYETMGILFERYNRIQLQINSDLQEWENDQNVRDEMYALTMPAQSQPMSDDDYIEAVTDSYSIILANAQATYNAKARMLYELVTKAQTNPQQFDGVLMTNANQLIADLNALYDQATQDGFVLNPLDVQSVEINSNILSTIGINGLNTEPVVPIQEEVVEGDDSWKQLTTTYKDSIEDSTALDNPNMKLSDVTGNSDFITTARFVISYLNRTPLLTVVYMGHTYSPIHIHITDNINARVFAKLMTALNHLPEGKVLVIPNKYISRTFGRFIDGEPGTLESKGIITADNLWDVEFTNEQEDFGLIKEVGKNGVVYTVVVKPGTGSTEQTLIYRYSNLNNTRPAAGTLVYMAERDYDEVSGKKPRVPVNIYMSNIKKNDAEFIVDLLLGKYRGGANQNIPFNNVSEMNETFIQNGTSFKLSNLAVLRLLMSVDRFDEVGKPHLHIELRNGKIVLVGNVQGDPRNNPDGSLHISEREFDIMSNRDQFVQFLTNNVLYTLQMRILKCRLRQNSNDRNHPFNGLTEMTKRDQFGGNMLAEILSSGNEVRFGNSSIVFTREMLQNPKKPDDTRGISGLAWYAKVGLLMTNHEGFNNTLLNIDNGVRFEVQDEKVEAPISYEKDTTPAASQDEIVSTIDQVDSLWDGGFFDKRSKTIDKSRNTQEDVVKDNIRKILGDEFTDEQVHVVGKLFLEKVDSMFVLGRCLKDSIILARTAEPGVEYHEAFHRVVEFLMTDKERASIYKAYRSAVKNKNLSDLEVAEGLADQFMWFMMNKPTMKITGVKSFFKTAIAWIKFFNKVGSFRLYRIYSLARRGKYANRKVNENAQKIWGDNPAFNFTVNGVDFKTISDNHAYKNLREGLAYAIFEGSGIKDDGSNIQDLEISKESIAKNPVIQNMLNNTGRYAEDGQYGPLSNEAKDVLREAIEKFDYISSDVVSFISQFATDYKTILDEENIEDMNGDEESINGAAIKDHIKNSYEFSQFSRSSSRVRFFFSRIPRLQYVMKDGKLTATIVKNNLGLPTYHSASSVFNMLLNEMHECKTIDEIISKCQELSTNDPTWGAMGRRLWLLKNKANEGGTKNWDAQSLLSQILVLMRSAKNEFIVGVASQDGIGHKIDLVNNDQQYNAQQYRKDWSDMFINGGSSYITTNDNGDYVMKKGMRPEVFSAFEEWLYNMYDVVTGNPNAKPYFVTINDQKVQVDITNEVHVDLLKRRLVDDLASLGIQFDKDMLNYMLYHKYGPVDRDKKNFVEPLRRMFEDQKFGIMSFAKLIGGLNKGGYLNITKDSHLYEGNPISQIFYTDKGWRVGSNSFVGELANWKWQYRHSKDQLNVLVTGGNRFYTISENNFISDIIREGNRSITLGEDLDLISELKEDEFYYHQYVGLDGVTVDKNSSEGSIFLKHIDRGGEPIQIKTLGGFKSDTKGDEGVDYSEIVTKEDYLVKAAILAQGGLVSPTMSDKKTWIFLSGLTLPGINYRTAMFSEQQFPTFETRNGVTILRQTEDVVRQFLEYIRCEYRSARKVLNDVNGYVDENGVEHSPLPNAMLVDNFHKGAEIEDKDGKIHTVIQGARMSGLTGIYLQDGTYIDFNRVLDDNGNYISEEQCLKELEEKFLMRQPKKDANGQYQTLNGEVVMETDEEMLERQSLAISLTLQHLLKNEAEYVASLGLIEKQRSGQWMYSYENNPSGLDLRYIDIITQALIKNRGIRPEDRTIELNTQLRSEALMIYLNDISVKHIISTIEHEKIFSGNPAGAKWVYDSKTGKLIDRSTDQRKRFGGLVSTGQNNDETIGLPSHYMCAEVDNEIVQSANAESVGRLIREGEVRSALIQQRLDEAGITFDSDQNEAKRIVDLVDSMRIEEVEAAISEDIRSTILELAESKAKDFTKVDVADGAAYMSDEMCENLLKQVGLFTSDVEEAFKILRDPTKVNDIRQLAEAYEKVWTTVIGNQKYTAYGTRSVNGSRVPYYNKMALFPMFKSICTGNMAKLYEKMKTQGIDLLMVKSAVKLGSQGSKPIQWNQFREDDDPTNENNFISGDVGNQDWKPDFNTEFKFNTYRQRYSLLRKQFNTDPKEKNEMSLGTQMTKVVMASLIPGREYVVNGVRMTATQMRDDIMTKIKNISQKGLEKLYKEFFNETLRSDGEHFEAYRKVDVEKLSKILTEELQNRGASRHQLEAVSVVVDEETGEKILKIPLAAQSNINWIQSILTSRVNKTVVDINSPGAAFIQRSVWGMEGKTHVRNDKNLPPSINHGKKLLMVNEEGSMDCVLSIDFFDHLIPKVPKRDKDGHIIYKTVHTGNFLKDENGNFILGRDGLKVEETKRVPEMTRMPFNEARQYLIDNGIIGGKANIVGYRIPTQALSSIHALRCVDVLPVTRDTIILPEEFTAITGSDKMSMFEPV